MSFSPLTGLPTQYSTEDNEIASGYYLKLYNAGTTVPYSMATDATGVTRLAKCKLNDEGYPISDEGNNDSIFVPHADQNYRAVLYKTAVDADGDITANAAYNVDNLRPDAASVADPSNVGLRNTTLEAQDDYDRSPLFVDGTDFTAGLGPHVITVPAGWTANAASMRYYKLDTAGTVTALTPTSSDATTFTLGDTLLSTDVIFIGDDTFRNQFDGDPDDIKERLGLTEAPDVTNYTKATTVYTYNGPVALFSITSNLTKSAIETIGPTGSGADNIWTAMDDFPADTKYIDLGVSINKIGSTQALSTLTVNLQPTGVTGYGEIGGGFEVSTGNAEDYFNFSIAKVALDGDNVFQASWAESGTGTDLINIKMLGFGT